MKPVTKEEEEVDVVHSWMEAGGFPAHPGEEAKGLLAEASFTPYFPILASSLHFSFVTGPSLIILAFYCYWLSLLLFRG